MSCDSRAGEIECVRNKEKRDEESVCFQVGAETLLSSLIFPQSNIITFARE